MICRQNAHFMFNLMQANILVKKTFWLWTKYWDSPSHVSDLAQTPSARSQWGADPSPRLQELLLTMLSTEDQWEQWSPRTMMMMMVWMMFLIHSSPTRASSSSKRLMATVHPPLLIRKCLIVWPAPNYHHQCPEHLAPASSTMTLVWRTLITSSVLPSCPLMLREPLECSLLHQDMLIMTLLLWTGNWPKAFVNTLRTSKGDEIFSRIIT